MARVTVEDCLEYVKNRYELVHLCTRRSRQLFRGADQMVDSKNGPVVTALREIAAGKVRFYPEDKSTNGESTMPESENLTQ